jgi:RNA polymerase sigma-70 factor (sigma-E family)
MYSTESAPVDISALYCTHRLSLVRLAILLVDDLASAEDVVQDAFVGLHRNQDRIREPHAAVRYLRTSVVNGSRSALRRRRTVRTHLRLAEQVAEEVTESAADAGMMLADEHREVFEAVQQLPGRQREVLLLRYWSDLSEADIADTLGISRGSVKSSASRGLDKLEAVLGGSR